jgi:hypothetical protein
MHRQLCYLLGVLALFSGGALQARDAATQSNPPQPSQQGGVPVYVDDGVSSECINRTTDSIWITLRRLIVTKPPDGWFTHQTDVAIYLNPTVVTEDAKSLTFPLLTKGAYGAYAPGQVSLPIDYTIVSSLALKQSSATYTGVHLEVTLLNENSRNRWGNALSVLADVTKKLPIPSNPYTQGASYLLDFTNKVVEQDLQTLTKSSAADVAKSGILDLTFDPTGKCKGDFAKTGTAAFLQSDGPLGSGHVDLGKLTSYCFRAQLRPAFVLEEAPAPAGGNCSGLPAGTAFTTVTNNYVAFYVNALVVPKTLAGVPAALRMAAETRCVNNGTPRAQCLTQ